jgi:hypothetical protein
MGASKGMRMSNWRHNIGIILLLAVVGMAVNARTDERLVNWTADWIGPAESSQNLWTCYRKSFGLGQAPSEAKARIAADSKYWLWINGKLVVREGGLKRGPTPQGTYYDDVDLAGNLVKGSNSVAVLVWHFGKHGFSHNSSGRAGLVFEADLGGLKLKSDASWKMKKHPAFGTAGDPAPNYRLPESSLRFDARRDIADWTAPGFDDAQWSSPIVGGIPPVPPWGPLERRPVPFWKDYGLKDYANAGELPTVADGKTIVAKLPYNAHVTPYLKIESKAGLTLDLRTDNFMGGSSPNVHAEYITRDGVQEFEAYGWMNGHAVHYSIPAGVKVLALKYRETGFATEFTGAFSCNDASLNTLWEKARRTLYVTMRDNYMDCPDRERAQWWGDAANELGEVFYAFDPAGASLTRKAMLELVCWQRPDKTLYSPVPAGKPEDSVRKDLNNGTWNIELPPQMLASIGKYGFWTYYFYTGDAESIRAVYPQVRDYLRIWQLDPDGLVIHRKGDWDWEDWGENIDENVLDSAWYHLALESAVKMAKLAGQDGDIAEWETRMKAIEKNFNARFWNGTEYRSPGYKGDTDDRANAMAVVAGLVRTEQFPALRRVLALHHNASPYMEKYVLESLFLISSPEQALERMKTRWRKQIASPLTTLWEGWGLGAEGFGGGTYNHAWSGGALTLLSQYAAGIAPLEPGYAVYQVCPQMGSLRKIQSTVDTVKGTIRLSLDQTTAEFKLKLESPLETRVRIGLPQSAASRVTVLRINGKSCDFRHSELPQGVKFLREDDDRVWVEAEPGTWSMEAVAR